MNEIFVRAAELIQDKKYSEAAKLLDDRNQDQAPPHQDGQYFLLKAEVCVQLGDYNAECIDVAVEAFRHTIDSQSFAKAKFLKGWALASLGDHRNARELFSEAYASYLRCNDRRGAARVLNWLAYSVSLVADISSSSEILQKCIHIYDDLGDAASSKKISHNLAKSLCLAGELSRAAKLYAENPYVPKDGDDKGVALFSTMSAIPHALLGDIKTARKTIAKAKPFLDDYPRERAIYFENLGLINILDGKYDAAEKALKQGLELSLKIAPESALISQIKRLFGDLYVATEQWDKAGQFTNEALEVAEKIGERVEIAACYRIFAQLEQHHSHGDKAREWFTKAIELFQLIGSNYELAVTRYLAGVSGLYQNGERQALLWMARQYFESEQVKPYLKKIDAALSISTPSRNAKKGDSVTVIAKSKVMTEIVSLCENVAESSMTVFLTGATGTGKDLLARYIHHHSGCTGEFVSVNAAAIPGPMIESELFGHTKGAFTGSDSDRMGLLQQADKGTFYLNEIADASMEFQTKLLEVLETRQVRRLGENKTRLVDFRLIAATNHDLKQRIAEGKFRLDLYHRLNEIPIELPPLSERIEDIPALIEFFLEHEGCQVNGNGQVVKYLGEQMAERSWTGNVRELRTVVRGLCFDANRDPQRMLGLWLDRQRRSESERLMTLLEQTGWNRSEVARLMGVSEGTIRKRIAKYALAER